MNSLVLFVGWTMAAVITVRCFMVIYSMDFSGRRCSMGMFWLFGLSYIALMMAALTAAIHIYDGESGTGEWLFLGASTGMILFDRRRRETREATRPHLNIGASKS